MIKFVLDCLKLMDLVGIQLVDLVYLLFLLLVCLQIHIWDTLCLLLFSQLIYGLILKEILTWIDAVWRWVEGQFRLELIFPLFFFFVS